MPKDQTLKKARVDTLVSAAVLRSTPPHRTPCQRLRMPPPAREIRDSRTQNFREKYRKNYPQAEHSGTLSKCPETTRKKYPERHFWYAGGIFLVFWGCWGSRISVVLNPERHFWYVGGMRISGVFVVLEILGPAISGGSLCWPGPSAEMCRGLLLYKFWRILPGIFLEDFSGHFFPQK